MNPQLQRSCAGRVITPFFSGPVTDSSNSWSRTTLDLRFKELLGRTADQEIRRVRLGHACHLLAHSRMSLNEVACAAGLGNAEYLSALMRKHHQMTPLEYRQVRQQQAAPFPQPSAEPRFTRFRSQFTRSHSSQPRGIGYDWIVSVEFGDIVWKKPRKSRTGIPQNHRKPHETHPCVDPSFPAPIQLLDPHHPPFFPAAGPATGSFNGLHPKSKFLAANS